MGHIAEFLIYQIDFLQFLLGTSFFFIALIAYVLYDEQDKREGAPWLWFSLFSASVAFCRLMGLFLSPLFAYGEVPFPKLFFLVISNIFLFRFVFSYVPEDKRKNYLSLLFIAIGGILLLAIFSGIGYSYIFAYIFMFFPLSVLTGHVFIARLKNTASRDEYKYFRLAGILIVLLGFFLPYPVGVDLTGVILLSAGVFVSGLFCFCLWRALDLQKKSPLFGDASADRNAGISMFFSVIALLSLGFIMVNYSGNYAYRVTMEESRIHMSAVAVNIEYKTEITDNMAKALSGSPYILPALLSGTAENLKNAYSVLDRYRLAMGASICYLMDKDGLVIASSNKDEKLSFVGKNYSFRPYFAEAIQGRQGRLFSIGVTTGMKGYYSSYPVFDTSNIVRGAVVVKQDLSQADLPGEQMVYLKIKGEKDVFLKSIMSERNFGRGVIGASIADLPGREFIRGGRRFIKLSGDVGSTGSEVGLIASLDLVAYFRMFAIAITFLLVFVAGLGNHFIRKQRYNNLVLKDKNNELLRKSEELEGFFGVNLDLLLIADLEGNFVKMNKEWEILLGYPIEELEKRKFLEFVHPEDIPSTLEAMSRLGKNEQVLEFVNRYRRKDGSYRYIEWRSHPKGRLIYAAARDITEKIAAEKSLAESRDKFDSMIKNVPGIVYRCAGDADWTMEFISDEVSRITGYPASDFINNSVRSFASITHPDDLKKVRNAVDDAVSNKSVYEMEYRLLTASGGSVWVREKGSGVFGKAGELLWLDGVIVDITTLKRHQDALKESEQWLSRSLMSIGDGVIACDPEAKVALINPVAEKLSGWSRRDAVARPIWEVMNLVNEKTGKEVDNPASKALKEGVVVELASHTVLISRDGRRIPIDDSAAPIKDSAGRILGAILVFRDISANIESDRRIRQLSRAVESSSASIVITDLDGSIQYVNPKFCDLTGYSAEEAMGQNPRVLKSGSQSVEFYKDLWGAITSGETWHGEFHNKKKDGSLYWEYASISPIKDEDGRITNYVAVKEDISVRKTIEIELLRKNEELEQLYRVKSDFTSMVSHELRTPLTSIKEGIGIVLDGTAGSLNQEQKEFLEISKKNVDRLHRLINDVLDFTKLESKKIVFKMKAGDISGLLKNIFDSYKPVCDSKGLYLNMEIEDGLPAVRFDEDRLLQVINNLVSNSLKFMDSGGITVKASFDKAAGGVNVCITDTGIGIKHEDIPDLFEKFIQLGSPSDRRTGGTGLGLAISREIVEAHHGKIWVESEIGKGSSFCFSLPADSGV